MSVDVIWPRNATKAIIYDAHTSINLWPVWPAVVRRPRMLASTHHSWPWTACTCLSTLRRSNFFSTRACSPCSLLSAEGSYCCCKAICTPHVDPQVCFGCKLPQLDKCAGNPCTKTKGCFPCILCHPRESWLLQPYICKILSHQPALAAMRWDWIGALHGVPLLRHLCSLLLLCLSL